MRTEMTLAMLCERLQANCGDMLDAAQRVGVSLIFVRQWRKDDVEVHERLTEAEAVGTQGLVSAAIQRGVHGVDEDVYFKGEVVGSKKNYSDGLLTTLLKAKVQEFSKEAEGIGTGVSVHVNIANVMPRAENYEDWLAMKKSTMKVLASPDKMLPDPLENVLEGEFEEVSTNPFAGIDL